MAKKQDEMQTRPKAGALAVAQQLPAHLAEFQGNRLGQEEAGRDDVLIPRLGLCQAGSPQKKKANAAFIEGLEEGDMFNTVTSEIYGRSVNVVPLFFFKNWIHFKDIDEGGGIIAQYKEAVDVPVADLAWVDGKPPVVTEFKNQMCVLVREDGSFEPIVASFKSTGIKTAKKWQSLINMLNAPSFVRTYRLEVVHTVKGNQEWEGLNVYPGEFVPAESVKELQRFFEQYRSTDVKFDVGGLDEENAAGSDPSGM